MGTIKADTVTGLADPNKATLPNTITMGSTTATLNFGNTVIANASAGSTTVTGEGGSTTTNLQQGLVKAWGKFDGEAGSIAYDDSFNLSGLTDNGTGDYTVNFASGVLANANYCITGSISWGSNQSRNILSVATTPNTSYTAATTTALRLESVNYGNGSAYDANSVSIAVFGD